MLSGSFTFSRDIHPENAPLPSLITESGISTDVRAVQFSNAPELISLSVVLNTTFFRFVQFAKAQAFIFSTFSGTETDVREEHESNDLYPIFTTVSGISTETIFEQF